MQIEKREIEYLGAGASSVLFWTLKKIEKKEVEIEKINENNIKISTEKFQNLNFRKVAKWRVLFYKYLPMFLISFAFLVHLDFDFDINGDGYMNLLVSVLTIFTALVMSMFFFGISDKKRNIEKKGLILIAIILLFFVFFKMELYIEFLMSIRLAPAFLIWMILIDDFERKKYKNTYYCEKMGVIASFQEDKASYIKVVSISVTIITLMLLSVQN